MRAALPHSESPFLTLSPGTQKTTIQTGHNIIFKTSEGRLIVGGAALLDAQEESQRPPKPLAVISRCTVSTQDHHFTTQHALEDHASKFSGNIEIEPRLNFRVY